MDLIYWSVNSSSRRLGGGGFKKWMGVIVILANCEYDTIRVHENLVHHPNDNILIYLGDHAIGAYE